MTPSEADDRVLRTTAGDFPLHEYRLRAGDRTWTALHTGAVLTPEDEYEFLEDRAGRLPYGVVLWPSAIALAHEVAARGEAFRDARVLELGAGTGLPGIVAASLGARVVQTDRHDLSLAVCRRNGENNGTATIAYRRAEWSEWDDPGSYDWVLGSDILYGGDATAPLLRRIFATSLAPAGRVLLADPFRRLSLGLLEALESEGWTIGLTRWDIGEESTPRPIGVYELAPPHGEPDAAEAPG